MRSTNSDHVPYDIYSFTFLLAALCLEAVFIWKQSLFKTSYLPVTQYHAYVIRAIYTRKNKTRLTYDES